MSFDFDFGVGIPVTLTFSPWGWGKHHSETPQRPCVLTGLKAGLICTRWTQGILSHGRRRLKNHHVRLSLGTVNIGTITGRSRKLFIAPNGRRIYIALRVSRRSSVPVANSENRWRLQVLLQRRAPVAKLRRHCCLRTVPRRRATEVYQVSDRLMSIKIDCETRHNNTDEAKSAFWRVMDLRSFGAAEHTPSHAGWPERLCRSLLRRLWATSRWWRFWWAERRRNQHTGLCEDAWPRAG